jgi:amino acid adenylation domain-containing protein
MQDATVHVGTDDAEGLLRLGDGGPLTAGGRIPAPSRFARIACAYPDRPALVCGDVELTYAELAAEATRLAARLRAIGAGPETVVGICLPRDARAVVAVLAVLQSGAAYLPLDPAHPVERRRYMLSDARAIAVVATPEVGADLAAPGLELVVPSEVEHGGANAGAEVAGDWPGPELDHLAYVLYTSGSTGKPKGVMVEHGSLAAFVDWALESFSSAELASVLASTSLGFDISMFELLVPLAAGGRIVLVENLFALDRDAVADVTLVNTVPSPLAAHLNVHDLPASVQTVIVAGEPLPAELAAHIRSQPGVERVVNAYGPTEDTIYSTFCDVPMVGRPPIGRPLPGTRAYVLDAGLGFVQPGEPGELCLAGAGLARGYQGRDDLTHERFVRDPVSVDTNERMYRTGDLACWRDDGLLEHLGRIDHQIKLRGVRIEPAEIESALLEQREIGQAVVVARPRDGANDDWLVAYVVAAAGATIPDGRTLRDRLRRTLPDPLVPSVYVTVDAMPLNESGKLDRKRLPEPREPGVGAGGSLTDTERRLGRLWKRVLGLDQLPGADDDFFELGGQSLVAFRLFDLIAEELGCDLPPSTLVQAGTLRGLAARVEAGPAAHSRFIAVGSASGHAPLAYVHGSLGGVFTLRRIEQRCARPRRRRAREPAPASSGSPPARFGRTAPPSSLP